MIDYFRHPLFEHPDGTKCVWLPGRAEGEAGSWFVSPDAGGDGHECRLAHPTDEERDRAERAIEKVQEWQERVASARRLLSPEKCWTLRDTEFSCLSLVGGRIGGGEATWTEDMCCLPCRLREALDG